MIVDSKIYTKPKNIINQLLNGESNLILQSSKNRKLFRELKQMEKYSINNVSYNPINGA